MTDQKPYENLKIKREKGASIEIEGELPVSIIATYEPFALEHIQRKFKMQGFREGKVPFDIIKKQLGDVYILEEAADMALNEIYPEIIEDEKLEVLGRPQVMITKLAAGNPVGFKIKVNVMPEIKLPDYKKIATAMGKVAEPVVEEKEVDDILDNLRKMRQENEKPETVAVEGEEKKEEKLPEIDDAFVKTLGNFANIEEFRNKIKENIIEEKKYEAKSKHRNEMVEKIIDAAKLELPEEIVIEELAALRERREDQAKKMGLDMKGYLESIKKTEEEVTKEEREYIERQMKTRFVLRKIADTEKISITEEEMAQDIELLSHRYPKASKLALRDYVETTLTNEKVLARIEGSEEKKEEVKAKETDEKTEV